MLKTFFVALVAVAMMSPSPVDAYGAYHRGYTHVGPNGVYHYGQTAYRGPYSSGASAHVSGYGAYGGAYHAGYGGAAYHPAYGGYHYGGTAAVGGYHYGYVR